ncbi:hypothetical protein SAMN05444287_2271 [Octadecabacter temperatus]|uniref:Uncharacterized protein n=1 Tax=Octadecabacter temperatus TaxID=1458307 RepID=A0A0K0Y1J6_9RHOB|nr:hypothetical protein OSB_02460 [Octadecabacter temperatus]SIO34953.1 hypothetical protein SAMN05444287_2271 [Octadecabacter temperatus]
MPSLPNSIALHIGAHKTASTHLQKILNHNRKILKSDGFVAYGPSYLRMTGRSLQAMFGLSASRKIAPRRSPHDQLAFLAKGAKRLVLSEENFVGVLGGSEGRITSPLYPTAPERIAAFIETVAPVKVDLFLGVRNPAAFMASAYSQTLFGGTHIGPRTFRARNDWRAVDWADYVARLRAVEGVGDFYVWRQEDYDATLRLIMRRMLRWSTGGKIEKIKESRVHQGLSAAAVRQTLAWAQEGRTEKLAGTARGLFPINDTNKAFKLYAASTLAESEAGYGAQMAQIEAMDGVTVLHPPNHAKQG